MAVDSQGNLYLTDFHNNRILKFNSPFTTDKVADEVWGQDDFTGYKCNKTDSGGDLVTPDNLNVIPPPASSTLCMGRNAQHQISFQAGVEIDSEGNMWVADSSNHRVLRFPNNGVISKTADLVLGQSSYTTRTSGSGLNQMNAPTAVRILQSGTVLVADSGNNRVLKFSAPFNNGMNGALFGSQFKSPVGIEIDPLGEGIWINDAGNGMVELWDLMGTNVKRVLLKNSYRPDGTYGLLYVTAGSLGIDSTGGILLSTSLAAFQSVHYFKGPITDNRVSVDKNLFYPPDGQNLRGDKGLAIPGGVAVKNNQVIVSDAYKILFWNDLVNLSNGETADGIVGVPDAQSIDPWGIGRIKADDQNHLWVARKSTVDVYQLPLTDKEAPLISALISSNAPLPVLGGGQISWGFQDQLWDIEPDPSGNYLWVSQGTETPPLHRVFRIRDPLTNPIVDVILGQPDFTNIGCNRYNGTDYNIAYSLKADNTVCFPGAVRIDKLGNIWVSDHSLEFRGNHRLLEFDASLLSNITNEALFGPNATLVSPKVQGWEPAFDSQNYMILGYNGQTQPPAFPGIYLNPLESLKTSTTPNMTLKDYFSHGYSAAFDQDDNLYIADLNRGRVLIYKKPINAPSATPKTTPTPFPQKGNLVGYWSMDEQSGDNVVDQSGNNNIGVASDNDSNNSDGNSPPKIVSSKPGLGNARSFDGEDDYINIADSNSLDLTGQFTFAFWAFTINPGGEAEILQKGTDNDCQNYGVVLNSRKLTALSSSSCSFSYTGDNSALPLNEWRHAAVVFDGNNISYYIDGALKDKKVWSGIGSVNTGSLVVGGGPNQQIQDYFGGFIDELGIWNIALSEEEILSLYNAGSGRPYVQAEKSSKVVAGVNTENLLNFIFSLKGQIIKAINDNF